jgi:hypothetical protein
MLGLFDEFFHRVGFASVLPESRTSIYDGRGRSKSCNARTTTERSGKRVGKYEQKLRRVGEKADVDACSVLKLITEGVDVGDLLLTESIRLDPTSVSTEDEVLRRFLVVRPFDASVYC